MFYIKMNARHFYQVQDVVVREFIKGSTMIDTSVAHYLSQKSVKTSNLGGLNINNSPGIYVALGNFHF